MSEDVEYEEQKKRELLLFTCQHIMNAIRHNKDYGKTFEFVVSDAKRKAERLLGRRRMP